MVVELNNISIKYKTGNIKNIGLKDYVINSLQGQKAASEFLAVKDVSFSLEKGDFLGLIGGNGAGKSTLLKVITGIMQPTTGTIKVQGKVSALLELASGFDGDMTVKENIYLRGAILGYNKEYIDTRYDSIIAFSELEDFQNTRFKQLSSGMKSRLAFSIASFVDPEILILDEVLSVGDAAFKKKSEQKMMNIIGDGVTTILVSHSLSQVRKLCNKVLWIEKGEQIMFGPCEVLCDLYELFMNKVLTIEECRAYYNSNISNYLTAAQINSIFVRMLKRKAEENELKEWFCCPNISEAAIEDKIRASAEYKNLLEKKKNAVYMQMENELQSPISEKMVYWIYEILLGRAPESDNVIQKYVSSRNTTAQVISSIRKSKEFRIKMTEQLANNENCFLVSCMVANKAFSVLFNIDVGKNDRALKAMLSNKRYCDIRTLLEHFTDKGTFVDLGAGSGAWSLQFASEGWKVFAYESELFKFECLKKNCLLNGDLGISCGNVAIIGKKKAADVDCKRNSDGVLESSLDDLDIDTDKISLVRLACRGNKFAILSAAKNFLERYDFPPVFCEITSDKIKTPKNNGHDFISEMISMGYLPFEVTENGLSEAAFEVTENNIKSRFLFVHNS